ncbi:hypothetical protein U875_09700 [Pandoraea pnomenusa 3kgm]|uniref:hypothetical protein n=1 Tax=Pandoraea pnomenusa TaxID=93220 RepID=UPI0003C76B77|nr:hypothetical protein [Pandoraea pnomenusa]AHB05621.1 hypothetical protein U875_09700 [Pandoraea pnomenusa 3kgm]
MAHWSDAYMFRPYIVNQFDCGDLARLVLKEVFHRDVGIPHARGTGPFADSALVAKCCDEIGVRTVEPADGDAVVMIARGRLAHVGVYYTLDGVAWVLHNSREARQVVRHRVRELDGNGFKLDGFYKWK